MDGWVVVGWRNGKGQWTTQQVSVWLQAPVAIDESYAVLRQLHHLWPAKHQLRHMRLVSDPVHWCLFTSEGFIKSAGQIRRWQLALPLLKIHLCQRLVDAILLNQRCQPLLRRVSCSSQQAHLLGMST